MHFVYNLLNSLFFWSETYNSSKCIILSPNSSSLLQCTPHYASISRLSFSLTISSVTPQAPGKPALPTTCSLPVGPLYRLRPLTRASSIPTWITPTYPVSLTSSLTNSGLANNLPTLCPPRLNLMVMRDPIT